MKERYLALVLVKYMDFLDNEILLVTNEFRIFISNIVINKYSKSRLFTSNNFIDAYHLLLRYGAKTINNKLLNPDFIDYNTEEDLNINILLHIPKDIIEKIYKDYSAEEHKNIDCIVFAIYSSYLDYLSNNSHEKLVLTKKDYKSGSLEKLIQ